MISYSPCRFKRSRIYLKLLIFHIISSISRIILRLWNCSTKKRLNLILTRKTNWINRMHNKLSCLHSNSILKQVSKRANRKYTNNCKKRSILNIKGIQNIIINLFSQRRISRISIPSGMIENKQITLR